MELSHSSSLSFSYTHTHKHTHTHKNTKKTDRLELQSFSLSLASLYPSSGVEFQCSISFFIGGLGRTRRLGQEECVFFQLSTIVLMCFSKLYEHKSSIHTVICS